MRNCRGLRRSARRRSRDGGVSLLLAIVEAQREAIVLQKRNSCVNFVLAHCALMGTFGNITRPKHIAGPGRGRRRRLRALAVCDVSVWRESWPARDNPPVRLPPSTPDKLAALTRIRKRPTDFLFVRRFLQLLYSQARVSHLVVSVYTRSRAVTVSVNDFFDDGSQVCVEGGAPFASEVCVSVSAVIN
jgi:hypothetical protein